MPTVVVATKYSQGKMDLGDPYTMAPFGFEFGFYYFIFLRCPSGILWDLITYDKCKYFFLLVRIHKVEVVVEK